MAETMEQVCWWRLKVEEARTEADGFASDAKQTGPLRSAGRRHRP